MRSPLLLSLALLAAAPAALAQSAPSDADVATRRELIVQAQHASDAGDHRAALDLAQRAGRIQMSPSLRDFVAGEQSSLGQLAEALGSAELCERDAQADPHALDRENVIRDCQALAAQLRPRVGRITVTVPTPTPAGLAVTVAGRALNEAFYGVPYVVDPGHVVVDASAAGRAPFHGEADVTAGATATLEVRMEVIEAPTVATPAPVATPPATATTTTTTAPVGTHAPSLVAPVIVLGAGAAVLIAGAVFGIVQLGAISMCGPNAAYQGLVCPVDDTAAQGALTWTVLADVGYIAGGVALAAGGAWLIASLMGHDAHASPGASARLDVAPAPGGGLVLGLRGAL